jgi:hypothetical protein
MKIKAFLILTFIFFSTFSYSWRSFSQFYCGADAIGIGTAYVGDASSESGVCYNPAGLVQLFQTNKNLFFSYEVYSSFKLIDIFAWNFKFDFDVFPFFFAGLLKEREAFSISLENLFYSPETDTEFYVRFLKFSFSYLLLDNLGLGVGVGPLFAMENNGFGVSFAMQGGILYKPFENFQSGFSFIYPFEVRWSKTFYGKSLNENYYSILSFGAVYKVSKEIFLYLSSEFPFYNQIKFTVDGNDYSPAWIKSGDFYFKPSVGIRFLERITGGHLSMGFLLDHNLTEEKIVNQYFLTLGFRGYGRNFRYYISFMDGYIISLFYRENTPRENINITLSFYF